MIKIGAATSAWPGTPSPSPRFVLRTVRRPNSRGSNTRPTLHETDPVGAPKVRPSAFSRLILGREGHGLKCQIMVVTGYELGVSGIVLAVVEGFRLLGDGARRLTVDWNGPGAPQRLE